MKVHPVIHFLFGASIAFIGMFLGYLWSPDYYEFVSNGYNFLGLSGFLLLIIFLYFMLNGDEK